MSLENSRLSISWRLGIRSFRKKRAKYFKVNERFSGRVIRIFRENTKVGVVEIQRRPSGNMGAQK